MKIKLTFLLLICFQISQAQVFTEVTSAPFVALGNAVFGDVDGDDDQDILMVGHSNQTMGKIYLNDGFGNYTLGPQPPFAGKYFSTIDLADIDGDNDLDVLITGTIPASSTYITQMYVNNGNGIFTEISTDLMNVSEGAVAFADIDGDGDQDVLITGDIGSNNCVAKLFKNDGTGMFEEVSIGLFVGACFGAVEFADVDGDMDLDVLIFGTTNGIVNLYLNDGTGVFTTLTLDEIASGSNFSFFDIDNDGDLDLITTGTSGSDMTRLYINDGSGSFAEDTNADFVSTDGRSHAVTDIDGDNDLDIIITGQTTFQQPSTLSTNLYLNDGNGNFSDFPDVPFVDSNGRVNTADVDGDNDQDVLIAGFDGISIVTKLYINETIVNTESPNTTDKAIDFSIHPNPLSIGSQINIKASANYHTQVSIRVVDLLGRIHDSFEQTLQNGENQFSLEVSKLAKGSYFVQFEVDGHVGIRKLLIH